MTKRNVYFVGPPSPERRLLCEAVWAEMKILSRDYDLLLSDRNPSLVANEEKPLAYDDVDLINTRWQILKGEEQSSVAVDGFVTPNSVFNMLAEAIFVYTLKYGIQLDQSNPLSFLNLGNDALNPKRRVEKSVIQYLLDECRGVSKRTTDLIVLTKDSLDLPNPILLQKGSQKAIYQEKLSNAHVEAITTLLEQLLAELGCEVMKVNGDFKEKVAEICSRMETSFVRSELDKLDLINFANPRSIRERYDILIYGPHGSGKSTLATKLHVELSIRNWNYGLAPEVGRSLRRRFNFEKFSSACERYPFMHQQRLMEKRIAELPHSNHGIITCTPQPLSFFDGAKFYNKREAGQDHETMDQLAVNTLRLLTQEYVQETSHLLIHIAKPYKSFDYHKDKQRDAERTEAYRRNEQLTNIINQIYRTFPERLLRIEEGTTDQRLVQVFQHLKTLPQFKGLEKSKLKAA